MPVVREPCAATEHLLQQACARNTPVELHYEDPTTKTLVVARARLLMLTTDSIFTDTPSYRDGHRGIPEQRPIHGHFMLDHARYGFKTRIEQSNARVQLNAHQCVRGLALKRPSRIETIQRRNYFRVSVAGLNIEDVDVARPSECHDTACAIDGHVGKARVVNISTGGIALLFDRRVLRGASMFDRFFTTLKHPSLVHELCLLIEVRYTRRIDVSESLLMGCAFKVWNRATFHGDRNELTRLITGFERELLSRNAT